MLNEWVNIIVLIIPSVSSGSSKLYIIQTLISSRFLSFCGQLWDKKHCQKDEIYNKYILFLFMDFKDPRYPESAWIPVSSIQYPERAWTYDLLEAILRALDQSPDCSPAPNPASNLSLASSH